MARGSRILGHRRELFEVAEVASEALGALAGRMLGEVVTRRLVFSRSKEPGSEPAHPELGKGAAWVAGLVASWLAKKLLDAAWDKAKATAQAIGQEAEARAQGRAEDAGSDPNPYEPTDAGVPAGTSAPPDEGADAGDSSSDDGGRPADVEEMAE